MGYIETTNPPTSELSTFISKWFEKLPTVPSQVADQLSATRSIRAKTSVDFGAVGSRHNDILSIAASLRAKGIDAETIKSTVFNLNHGFAEPLPENEVYGILDWANNRSEISDFPVTSNVPLSDFLAQKLKDRVRWVDSGIYRVFRNGRWKDDPDGVQTRSLVIEEIRKLILELKRFSKMPHEKETLKEINGRIRSLENFRQNSVMELFKAEKPIFTEESTWNNARYLALENGVFDLQNLEFTSPQPELLLSKQLNVKFDPDARAPRTIQFLEEILDKEFAEFVLQVFAKSLIADSFSQRFYCFVGKGANGKSVLVELFKWLFGDYAVSLPSHALTERSKSGPTEEISALKGALVSLFPELPSGAVLNASMIKSFTGGDTLFARRIYGHGFQFISHATPIMTSNFLPVIDGGDGGMKRRVILLPFEKIIPEKKRNPNLLNELKEEGPGILNELIVRIPKLKSEGLIIPDKIRNQTNEFVDTANLIERFAEENLEFGEKQSVLASRLYSAYQTWASMNGYKPLSRNSFDAAFMSAFPSASKQRRTAGMAWSGVACRSAKYIW